MSLPSKLESHLDAFDAGPKQGLALNRIHPDDDEKLVAILVEGMRDSVGKPSIHVDDIGGWARDKGWTDEDVSRLRLIFETAKRTLYVAGQIPRPS